jgi:CheY-like chemotaxis protein
MSERTPQFVLVDAVRLRQVLFNLVGNALKFTHQGKVELAVDAQPNGAGAVLLHISVRDTGPGIAKEDLPRLFNRFTQADDSEVRKFGGTGLGLAICKQLVELMGGRIWAESAVGKGSTFHVKLPLALAEAAAPAEASEGGEPAASVEGLKVLAVDDNSVNLLVLDQLLSSLGFDVSRAGSGAEALQALATEPFDLVLMDIQMPEMSGAEAVKRLRAAKGPNQDAPVVALTADVTSGGRKRYLKEGFDEHCAKPIKLDELMGAVARALAAREGRALKPPAARARRAAQGRGRGPSGR